MGLRSATGEPTFCICSARQKRRFVPGMRPERLYGQLYIHRPLQLSRARPWEHGWRELQPAGTPTSYRRQNQSTRLMTIPLHNCSGTPYSFSTCPGRNRPLALKRRSRGIRSRRINSRWISSRRTRSRRIRTRHQIPMPSKLIAASSVGRGQTVVMLLVGKPKSKSGNEETVGVYGC
ncbi:hypothetical protein EJ06DRAFT_579866 [Trichodelitschia bisporula]|uniref:Uncharacterized protein n=1 Tax=Trichodelitschia bisporula TaxID=703511 RepID=A0A6G1I7I9_9PEZI|nr:hypothetical protein EJ06DRAFT_579866 [Trichodelitschia bisporula]